MSASTTTVCPTHAPSLTPPLSPTFSIPGIHVPVARVFAGVGTIALTTAGSIYVRGENAAGELGLPAADDAITAFTLVPLPFVVTDVLTNGEATLLRAMDGTIYAAGDGTDGRLGVPLDRLPSAGFTAVAFPVAGAVTQIALSHCYSYFIVGSELLRSDPSGMWQHLVWPAAVTPEDVAQLAGNAYDLYLLTTDGAVWQCGARGVPRPDATGDNWGMARSWRLLDGLPAPVTHLAAGHGHLLLLTEDDTCYVYGVGAEGELGLGAEMDGGANIDMVTTVQEALPAQRGHITDIYAGLHTSFIRARDGTVYAAGDNRSGQLGRDPRDATPWGDAPCFHWYQFRPLEVAGSVHAVAAGQNHSILLQEDGRVVMRGMECGDSFADDADDAVSFTEMV